MLLEPLENPAVIEPGLNIARPLEIDMPWQWRIALIVFDALMFLGSTGLAALIVSHRVGANLDLTRVGFTAVLAAFIFILAFERFGLYRKSQSLLIRDECYYTIVALMIAGAPFLIVFTIVPSLSSSRLVVVLSLAFATFLVPAMRFAIYYLRMRMQSTEPPVMLVGKRERIDSTAKRLDGEGVRAIRFEADIDADLTSIKAQLDPSKIPWLQHAENIGARTIILTEIIAPDSLRPILWAANRKGITIAFATPRIIQQSYSLILHTVGSQTLLVAQPLSATRPVNIFIKRCLDISLGFFGLLVFSPIMLLCAVAIFLESGGPVLYRQVRVGKNGLLFNILKFRSMPVNIEHQSGAIWSPAGDTRTTRVGKLLRRISFDELPQIFNVLSGEMSIVGPRPERPIFVDQFRSQVARYDERHLVPPGITGCSQIHLARKDDQTKISDKVHLDLYYIQNWSLLMDLSLIFKTAAEFLFQRAF